MKPPANRNRRPIHPALDFDRDQASVGILDAAGVPWVIGSDRRKRPAERLAQTGLLLPPPLHYVPLADRWPEHDLTRFVAGDPPPKVGPVLDTMATLIENYCELTDPRHARLIASWAVGSYVFPLFATFPRLHFQGEGGSGKSKLPQLISLFGFNGLLRISPTPAGLFRLISALRPTLCLDEIEGLDTTDRKEILAIINSGYKQGGAVDRIEREGDSFKPVAYVVYAPMALGGIAALNKVTADRAITITTQRGTDPATLNREIKPERGHFAHLRGQCYRVALTRFKSIRETYSNQQLPSWLVARQRELYCPLVAIATLADAEGADGAVDDLLSLAREEASERDTMPPDTGALLTMLQKRLSGAEGVVVRPVELAAEAGRDKVPLTSKRVGLLLDNWGFKKTTRDRYSVRYRVDADQLARVLARYESWASYTPTSSASELSVSRDFAGVDRPAGVHLPDDATYTGASDQATLADAPFAPNHQTERRPEGCSTWTNSLPSSKPRSSSRAARRPSASGSISGGCPR